MSRKDKTIFGAAHGSGAHCRLAEMFLPVEDAGMNPTRLVFVIVAGCCLLRPEPLADVGRLREAGQVPGAVQGRGNQPPGEDRG